ncbi:MAG: hypothetical protein ACLPN1_16810 [Dissulfurispiraceae bacterium]
MRRASLHLSIYFIPSPMLFGGTSPDIFNPALAKAVRTIVLSVGDWGIPAWIKDSAAKKGISFASTAI